MRCCGYKFTYLNLLIFQEKNLHLKSSKSMIINRLILYCISEASSPQELSPSTKTLAGHVSSTLETKTHSDMQYITRSQHFYLLHSKSKILATLKKVFKQWPFKNPKVWVSFFENKMEFIQKYNSRYKPNISRKEFTFKVIQI